MLQTWYLGEIGETPLGHLFLLQGALGLLALVDGARLDAMLGAAMEAGIQVQPDEAMTAAARRAIWAYLGGERMNLDLPIYWAQFSDFRRRVLQATTRIPYGETRTYGEIAAAIGQPRAARAVGQALRANPLPIVIPCHRVVGADGHLTGYGGPTGLQRKRWLLRLEGVQVQKEKVLCED